MTEKNEVSRMLSFLGLCRRAGRVTGGIEACMDKIRSGKAKLFLLDESASENTKKSVKEICFSHHIQLYLLPEGTIGHAIGQPGKMSCVFPEDGMTEKMISLLQSAGIQPLEFGPGNAGNS